MLTENSPEVEQVLERDLRATVATILGDTSARVRIVPSWGAPAHALIQMAQEEHADLIIVGTHQRHGLSRLTHPSVSRAILHHMPGNVACVPASFGASSKTVPIPEIRRVLVTSDFSERGNHAIPYAYSVLAHGGLVRLIHVMTSNRLRSPIAMRSRRPSRLKQDTKGAGELTERLRSLIPLEAAERGIHSDAAVLEGRDIATAVCQEADRFGADVICIGSHGHSRLTGAVLGSVSQKVVANSRRPVFVVRPPPA